MSVLYFMLSGISVMMRSGEVMWFMFLLMIDWSGLMIDLRML